MSIILPLERPAIDVVSGSYESPVEPWALLAEPANKARLEVAIAAVGRVDFIGHPDIKWGGTAFVVGPDLIMTSTLGAFMLEKHAESYSFISGRTAVVDFGHERDPSDSLRVNIEEVVYVDPITKIELVRATIPNHIVPLELSRSGYAELEARAVAIIGYPAWDTRAEASVMQRIFRGVVDVKRVLPGGVLGRGSFHLGSGEQEVLLHDCTTTGGCGGAPLIDIGTGQVVGVHFAGVFLKENYAVLAANLSADSHHVHTGAAFTANHASKGPFLALDHPEISGSDAVTNEHREMGPLGPELAGSDADDIPPTESFTLEAIILPRLRPALLAETWMSEVGGSWKDVLKPYESRINLALRSVGKLFSNIETDQWLGTAFLVGERLALTASFGLNGFVRGAGVRTTLNPGARAAIDFSDALGKPQKSAIAAITGVKFIHPFFQLALLELESTPNGTAALNIASQLPSDLAGRPVALLSCASGQANPPFDRVYQHGYRVYQHGSGRLFLQPGNALQISQIPGSPGLPALVHDCTSAEGSAGGPVLDLGTGYAIGIHTHSKPREVGFAQAAWEFARDPYVWQYEIGLWPNPRPAWLGDWDTQLAQQPQKPVDPPSRGQKWIDVVPIIWSDAEPKELERLLILSIEPQIALYVAEGVGLQLGTVNSNLAPMLFWRDLLKKASLAGVLRRMLEELAAANAGLAPKLASFL
jgi:Trypsin-like peptidase domain